jgi:hypothetical protein
VQMVSFGLDSLDRMPQYPPVAPAGVTHRLPTSSHAGILGANVGVVRHHR